MTLVTGTVQDLGYDGMEGTLWARPARFRSDGSVVYAPERKPFKITGGVVSAELAPGPAVLELQVGSHARDTFEVVIPEVDTTLADLLDAVFPWEPEQVSLFVAEREAAEAAAADAETAAATATTAAQQAGQDRAHVDQVRVLLDETYDESQAGMALPPRLMESELNATYASQARVGAQPPRPLSSPTYTTATVTPIEFFDGALWGVNGSIIHRSTDEGATWPVYATAPSGVGVVRRVLPTADGGAVVVGATGVVKASSWATTPVFSALKVTVNGAARISQFQADGDGTKFIVAEYGPGLESRTDSRYAHISTDMGETWTAAYDSVALQGAAANDSHVHGCCYDPWEDVFYVAEGHTVGHTGVWLSRNDGASWTLYDGYRISSTPTVIVATDDGLVLGSDDAKAGMLGIPRVGPIEDRQIIHTWAWRAGNDGVLGFGLQGARDPETGVVYIAFRTAIAGLPPVIAAGTATAANVVYTHPVGAAAVNGDVFSSIALLPSGKVLSRADVGGSSQTLSAWRTSLGPSTFDRGGISGGVASMNTSISIGAGSTTGDHSWTVAAGVLAAPTGALSVSVGSRASAGLGGTALGESAKVITSGVAIGRGTNADADNTVAIGTSATATGGEAMVMGYQATGSTNSVAIGGNAVAEANTVVVGRGATTTGGAATVVGTNASAATSATVVGSAANASTSAVAIGRNAVATGSYSVALGRDTVTDHAYQASIGPRNLMMLSSTSPSLSAVTGGGALWVEGGRLWFRSESQPAIELAFEQPEPEPTP